MTYLALACRPLLGLAIWRNRVLPPLVKPCRLPSRASSRCRLPQVADAGKQLLPWVASCQGWKVGVAGSGKVRPLPPASRRYVLLTLQYIRVESTMGTYPCHYPF